MAGMAIKNNMSAMRTLNLLNGNQSKLAKDLQRVSSGQRINSAGDDASGYAISERMRVQIRAMQQDSRNVRNGRFLLQTALGGLEQIKSSLEKMAMLADQASNGLLTDFDRAVVGKEFDHLRENITDIAVGTEFNAQTPLHPLGEPKPQASPSGGKVDIVFLVDTTSTMAGFIQSVASEMNTFTSTLTSANIDFNIGIVSFNDEHISPATVNTGSGIMMLGEGTRNELSFTNDSTAVSGVLTQIASEVGGVGQLRGLGGSCEPESGLEGVEAAISMLSGGRSDANKEIIVISDATFQDSSDTAALGFENGSTAADYLSASDVIDDLQAANIRLSAVTLQQASSTWSSQITNQPWDEWGWLTSATGGDLADIRGNYGANLTAIASAISGGSNNTSDSIIQWRNILRADNGFSLGSAYVKSIHIQSGTRANQSVTIPLYDHIAEMLKLDKLSLSNRDNAIYAREALDVVIQKILDQTAEYGALASRLEKTDEIITLNIENALASESTIRDADMVKEMTEYTKHNVLLQAAQSMLAQANQNSSSVLSLLQ